uniref:Uncharacterized protein n=1 Tax=Arundo donax TaxID=35708 RepID=A0A0A9D0R4_ARUDO
MDNSSIFLYNTSMERKCFACTRTIVAYSSMMPVNHYNNTDDSILLYGMVRFDHVGRQDMPFSLPHHSPVVRMDHQFQ